MIYKCTNAYYFAHLNSIGGVESHFYYLSKKYGDLDLTIFYRSGDEYQINRLKKNVRCKKITNDDRIICDRIFVCYNRDVLDICEAKEKYLVLHADYKDLVERSLFSKKDLPIDPRIDKYIGVSQLVCDSWKEVTGIDAENVYEPIVLDEYEKPLMFISATRLTREKGWDRMQKLANILDANNVNYQWLIYTDAERQVQSGAGPNMVICKTRLDITSKLESFDAYIQLSDNEGFCLSVIEALMKHVPVIGTDLPVFKELGLNESNSVILDHELEHVPIDRIKDIYKLKFDYKPPEDKWADFLLPVKTTYSSTRAHTVRALDTYQKNNMYDAALGRIPEPGEVFQVIGDDRLDILLGENARHEPFVELVK